MTSDLIQKYMVRFYIAMFFLYLFGPLILMGVTAFNSPTFPTAIPIDELTLKWFSVLANDKDMIQGIKNSLWIGLGVVCVAVPIGLAAALLMSQVHKKAQSIYYMIVVSPLLTPGVILGISTLVFWDRLGVWVDADYNSVFYSGIFLSIIGQSTFISAYCMLIFLSRLQRFDRTQEEAALDLGATNVQVFWKILIPFLRPAIGSAAFLAFLTSFENYNTTLFTIQAESTLTTVLAGKVRLGTNPSLSALAVVIVGITLVGAVTHEIYRRREMRREALAAEAAKRAAHIADKGMAPV
ncbi:spermidine/putrescine ABC transporter permease [Kiloniella litopenaei]|uniref:Spermidine/putrescine ABC transporter permease n=1 Tax=Kiloniella litopenaei TaxID=1549748 RepID=A0A0M2RBM7_9PROT|nr:ABC transporter permease [Kiloniella litopenaei]KKJ77405.1 spermidine/putrescine ABC transporter permease [Kiloniella litopenaei]